jgi:hypothetical protein
VCWRESREGSLRSIAGRVDSKRALRPRASLILRACWCQLTLGTVAVCTWRGAARHREGAR